MSDLLEKWLRHYDPVHRGWTPTGIANGVCTARGFGFPRMAGGYNLYRATLDDEGFLHGEVVGAVGANAAGIETFGWRPGRAGEAYRFAVCAVGGGGIEGETGVDRPAVAFDAAAVPAGLRPNDVSSVRVAAVGSGRLKVSWGYVAEGEEIAPVEFRVYSDGGLGEIDLDAPIGIVPYRARGGRFRFVTAAFGHDLRVRFVVRAASAAGELSADVAVAEGRADAEAPPVVGVLVERVERG